MSLFEHANLVTSTTCKILHGPWAGMIFARTELMRQLNAAVFPILQGRPHNHKIRALSVAQKEATTPTFEEYAAQVVANAKALREALVQQGYKLMTGKANSHIVLWDALMSMGLTGPRSRESLSCLK